MGDRSNIIHAYEHFYVDLSEGVLQSDRSKNMKVFFSNVLCQNTENHSVERGDMVQLVSTLPLPAVSGGGGGGGEERG